MSIDAHVHLWELSTDPQDWIEPATMSAIDRDFGTLELREMLVGCEIDRAVVVQAGNSAAETRRLLTLAESSPDVVAGVVGWLDLSADVDAQLTAIGEGRGQLAGVRHLVHVDPDPTWLSGETVARGLDRLAANDLGFDLVLRSSQLELAAQVVAAHPETRFVLDHLGGIAETKDDSDWESGLRLLARESNVVAKLSGLAGMAPEPRRQRQALDVAFDVFTPDRLMYGSDWPLTEISGGVLAWHAAVVDLVRELSAPERERILAGTATEHYRLATE